MTKLPILLLRCWLAFGFTTSAWAVSTEQLLQPDEAFQLTSDIKDPLTLRLSWRIADGYYLYRQKFKFVSLTPGIESREAAFPKGQNYPDKQFGDVEIYRERLEVELPIRRPSASSTTLMLEVNFQGCANIGVCYLPIQKILAIELPATETSSIRN